jgi:hypothetical protein
VQTQCIITGGLSTDDFSYYALQCTLIQVFSATQHSRLTAMKHITVVFLLSTAQVIAQNVNPNCIDTCAEQYPTRLECDRGSVSPTVSTCECDTLLNSTLVECWRDQCDDADKRAYLENGLFDEPCRSQVFPGLFLDGNGIGNSTEAPSTPVSSDVAPTSTADSGIDVANQGPSSAIMGNSQIAVGFGVLASLLGIAVI